MAFLDSVLSPILQYNPAIVIISLSIILSVLITLIYKWMTDQSLMKSLKDDIKKSQEDMKKHKDNPKKMLEIQKSAMEKNMKYMMHSMKPTLITFIPLILVFGWLNAHYTYDPIAPGQEFALSAQFENMDGTEATILPTEGIEIIGEAVQKVDNGMASWKLKGTKGEHLLQIEVNGKRYDKDVIISDINEYSAPAKPINQDSIKSINIEVRKLRVFGEDFKIINWHPGWLGVYIITSIIFSMTLRKLLKLH
ncbi:MAG: hypothetical protein QS98_C0001G0082 [archaeon GW2011_AR3]|nr:MAG: hypothetical protein QS98_C0001G0082 [archaeon GW2011_AR3]MBS3109360.1 DUF106 domain-containing protein [Candidatus Woesearchaeota archaeon]